MTLEQALHPKTRIPLRDAVQELRNHGWAPYRVTDKGCRPRLECEGECIDEIIDDTVLSHAVMVWLGY